MRPYTSNKVRIKEGVKLDGFDVDLGRQTGVVGYLFKNIWEVYLDDVSIIPKSYRDMRDYYGQESCLIYISSDKIEFLD